MNIRGFCYLSHLSLYASFSGKIKLTNTVKAEVAAPVVDQELGHGLVGYVLVAVVHICRDPGRLGRHCRGVELELDLVEDVEWVLLRAVV